jgi:subtilisin family serine protease
VGGRCYGDIQPLPVAVVCSQADRTRRGQQVVDTLRSTARNSQAGVRAVLDAAGVKYESLWVSNAIRVRGGSKSLVDRIAAISGVARIEAPPHFQLIKPVRVEPADVVATAVEWGIANINADDVWTQLGVRGEGIVVASIDTGVQLDHPALVSSYRGNKGDGTFAVADGLCPGVGVALAAGRALVSARMTARIFASYSVSCARISCGERPWMRWPNSSISCHSRANRFLAPSLSPFRRATTSCEATAWVSHSTPE